MNGIHGLPMLSSGVRLWGSVLGNRLPLAASSRPWPMPKRSYNWADDGVVVVIQP